MLRQVLNTKCIARQVTVIAKRTYLTENYKCTESFESRLKSPILERVSIENLYFDIDAKFHQQKKVSAIDIDIYANKIIDDKHTDEIADLVQKLRLTEEASNILDSTGHALIRSYIENNQINALVQILNHRLEYGIYLDNFTANLLLDKLVTEKNWKLAARVATLYCLQEDFENEITNTLSMYACFMFLDNLETFDDFVEQEIEKPKEELPKSKKKKEEIRIRVGYLRNEYHDDHFDIRNTNHLVGKTLLYLAKELKQNDALKNNLELLGYTLYEKFDDGIKLLETQSSSPFFADAVAIVQKLKAASGEENEIAMKFFNKVDQLNNLQNDKVNLILENLVQSAVEGRQSKDIEQQKMVYESWTKLREDKLNEEIDRLNRIQRLRNLEKITDDMQAEEKKLWFFDNEDKIDLEIDAKRVFYPKRWFGKKKNPRVVDEHYIPPDVDARHILVNASSINNHVIQEEQQLVKAVQDSMAEWKIRSSKHRQKREDKVVCYGNLGCFEDSGTFMLPSSPEEINTKFIVYSSKNRNASTNNQPSPFNATKVYNKFGNLNATSIKVIIHGFGASCPHVWVYDLRAALMAVQQCIVICVDWENGATLPNYVRAAANTRLVGKQLAFLLHELHKNNDLEFSNVHLIGFSLGAHVAGFAGAEQKSLHRITGLDPAGPLFESQHPNSRLDESDAEFVDVIHSNGENLILGGLGSWQPMGTVDYYPNGGRVQSGCSNLFVGAVTDIIWSSPDPVEGRSLCNHRRAYKFFIDSIAPRCLFPAFPCESYEKFAEGRCFMCDNNSGNDNTNQSVCGNMGYYADKSTGRGQLYLRTREEEPYCAHQYKLKIQNSYNDLPLRTLGRIEVELESDGGLTEAFTVTERDDQELFAGHTLSKILVPHPALNFPTNVTITYQVYRGWLSRGMRTWSINKVMLSDSFGASFSLCSNFDLTSGVPVRMTLLAGDCRGNEIDLIDITTKNTTVESTTEWIKKVFNKSDVVELGKHIPITLEAEKTTIGAITSESNTTTSSTFVNEPWKPIHATNSAIKIYEKNETVLDDSSELFLNQGERMPKKTKTEKRSFGDAIDDLNNVANYREDSISLTDIFQDEEEDDNKIVTVQLFPYRLGAVFEKAERYARLTLFPLMSEQFSNIFKFDSISEKSSNDQNDKPIILKPSDNPDDDEDEGSQRNFHMKENLKFIDDPLQPPIQKLLNGNNLYSNQDLKKSSTDVLAYNIKIDLPTYSPPVADVTNKFIPIQRTVKN
ncbi:unnamed protein product [Diamesa serratosioi]